jgi:hypothetical protein
MSGLYVIVDDRDQSITWSPLTATGKGPYANGWTYDGVDAEFMNTTTLVHHLFYGVFHSTLVHIPGNRALQVRP